MVDCDLIKVQKMKIEKKIQIFFLKKSIKNHNKNIIYFVLLLELSEDSKTKDSSLRL